VSTFAGLPIAATLIGEDLLQEILLAILKAGQEFRGETSEGT
jgi:DNA-directed RNA polymerase specialized sigma24 family protein